MILKNKTIITIEIMIIDIIKRVSLFVSLNLEIPKISKNDINNRPEIYLVFLKKLINCSIVPIVYTMSKCCHCT